MFNCSTKTFSTVATAAIAFFLLTSGLFERSAIAQEGMEGYKPAADDPDSDPGEETESVKPVDPDAAKHGIGLRLRYVFFPKSMIELFVEEAASGVGQPGFGLDYVYRKKKFEFSVGFEYDKLSGDDGIYVERNGSTSEPGTVDFVEFKNLAWFTIDASFVWHHPLSELVALRYGGGFGFGIVSGDILETDAACLVGASDTSDCIKPPNAPQFEEKQDFFRFPPVFNALAGVQFTPGDNLAINIELGLRTIFYTGVGVQYFF